MSYSQPKTISQLNLSNTLPISLPGAALTPLIWQDDTGIAPDPKYFNVVLPTSDITINFNCRIRISASVAITRGGGGGPTDFALQLFRDQGVGFALVQWVTQPSELRGNGSPQSQSFDTFIDANAGDVFRVTEIRAGGSAMATVFPRQAMVTFDIVNLL